MNNSNNNITFPSCKTFSPNKLEENADGFYKIQKTGIKFYRPSGEIFAMLKKTEGELPFFISANRREDLGNKIYYSYLSSREEEYFGFDKIRYMEKCAFAENIYWAVVK